MIPVDNRELKQHILENYDQITVFATYLEIPESDINYCLENKSYKINNPLRIDRDPSVGFIIVSDKQSNMYKLKMYDFADPYWRGDCFDIVGKIRGLNSTKGLDFVTICNDIIYSMRNKLLHHNLEYKLPKYTSDNFTNIIIEPRLWTNNDINFWNDRGLPFNEIRAYVFPLKRSYISNYCDYIYDENDPGYAWITGYYNNKTLYKLYFPNRTGKDAFKPRFKSNNKYYPLESIHELKPADILVITKSFKEKRLLKRLIPKIHTKYTVEVSNFTSESVILNDDFVLKLYDIYGTVVTNVDFDHTGLTTSGKHKRKFGMLRFIPTNGKYNTVDYGGKDLCDIFKNKGEEYTISLIAQAYIYLQELIDIENERTFSYETDYNYSK